MRVLYEPRTLANGMAVATRAQSIRPQTNSRTRIECIYALVNLSVIAEMKISAEKYVCVAICARVSVCVCVCGVSFLTFIPTRTYVRI